MNTKQIKQLKIAFGVVVFLGVGNCCGLVPSVINPGQLKAFVSKTVDNVKVVPSGSTEDWNVEMLPDELDHFDEQLDMVQNELGKHGQELAQVTKMLANLHAQNPSDPYIKQLEEVKKALLMLRDRLVEIEKSQVPQGNVNQQVNVNVGGGDNAALGAISTAGYVFGKLCDAVKYFGPSLINYYIVSQAFALVREHREAMVKMMADMQRLLAEQAAHAGEDLPQQPQVINPVGDSGFSWMNTLSAAAFIVPLLYNMLQGASFQLPKSDGVLGAPLQPEPRAWRFIGAEKIPVR